MYAYSVSFLSINKTEKHSRKFVGTHWDNMLVCIQSLDQQHNVLGHITTANSGIQLFSQT